MINNTVYLELDGGLGDRIRNLCGVLKFFPEYEVKILWHHNNHLNCQFNKLFKNTEFEILDPAEKPKSLRKHYEQPDERPLYILYEMQREFPFFNEAKRIIPTDYINDTANEFSEKYNLNNRIGFHIRRGDMIEKRIYNEGEFYNQRCIRPDQFIEIYRNNLNELFFLCSEDTEIHKLFDSRMCRLHHTGATREKEEDVINAYIDILLLSKTKKIYGGWSAFSVVANAISNNKLEILFNTDSNYWKSMENS
jgi:hypothetical protein